MYRIDFYAGDKKYYNFEFEIYKKSNDDPYATTGEYWFSKGAWNSYAFLHDSNNGNLLFGFFLNHDEFAPDPSNKRATKKDIEWNAQLFKDGKLFATRNQPVVSRVERGKWSEESCALPLKGKSGEYLKLSDLTNGNYKIQVQMAGESNKRNYSFSVKDNKIVRIDKQDRTKNKNPMELIEGWSDNFWLKLEK